MKFPIDVEKTIAEFRAYSPDNAGGETALRVCIPMINAAYRQGLQDAEISQRGCGLLHWWQERRRRG